MAVAPGIYFLDRASPPPRSAPTDTGVAFMVGLAASGPLEPTRVTSLATFTDVFGARQTDSHLYDAVEVALAEGTGEIWIARVVGPAGTPEADDRINVTDASYAEALARLPKALGPGQVSAPGESSAAIHAALLAHAAAANRVAMLDPPDSADAADLIASAATARADANARFGAMWGPWADVAGIAPGTTRRVPYSAIQTGITARTDATASANVAAAGFSEAGRSLTALDLAAVFTDAERGDLNDAGVNVARIHSGAVYTYGYRSLADPADPTWLQFTNVRFRMELQAMLEAVAEGFVFAEIDGRGQLQASFAGALSGALLPYYGAGSLYGASPAEAFRVDAGAAVNPPEQLAAGEMRAVVGVRMSPFGERVYIELTKVAITEVL